ncbi:MAG TPA: transglutaminase-like domain-containing protein [Myxococcota bacterium]|nr:transglutaminase-like domain-containing protein [Myxococcota bacterium]HRY93508.1 transglutaminase-like domain-containing protein [Myxococcota bacterium]HSA21951.1 transglutaminase-like domain-containing protein [Myxococcota bacterium]
MAAARPVHVHGIALALAALAALLAAGCQEDPPASPHAALLATLEPWPECAGVAPVRTEYQVLIQGKPAGRRVLEERRCDTPRGARRLFDLRQRSVYLRRGDRLDMEVQARVLDDAAGRVLRYHERAAQTGTQGLELDAGRVGDEMLTVRGQELRRVPFEAAGVDDWLVPELAWPGRLPRPGERLKLRAYTSSTASFTDLEVVALEADPGRGLVLEQTLGAEPSTRLRWELTPARGLRRLVATTGVLTWELRPAAPGQVAEVPAEPVDLTDLMRLELSGRPLDPDRQDFVRFLLTRLPDSVKAADFEGPGQRALPGPAPGSVVIEAWRLPPPPATAFPPSVREPALRSLLEPTALAQADHPEIAERARALTRGAADAWEAAHRLRAWVAAEVDGSLGFAFASALDTLRRKQGDCSEMALLLTALARAAGIPARPVYGLAVSDGALISHMWTEVWVGEWRPLDAALGAEHVSPARLRLAETSTGLSDDESRYQTMSGLILSGMQVLVEEAR